MIDLSGLPDQEPRGKLSLAPVPSATSEVLRQYYRTTTTTPDEYSKVADAASRLPFHPDMVERNLRAAQMMADEPDWEMLNRRFPKTTEALSKDVELFKLANDDIENLGWWEDASIGSARGRAMVERGRIFEKVRKEGGVVTEEQGKRLQELAKVIEKKGAGGPIENAAEFLGQMSATIPEAVEYGLETGMVTGGAAALAGPGAPITVPAATAAGFTAGMVAKMFEQSYYLEGQVYGDMLDEGVPENVASIASAGVGIANAVLEVAGLGIISAPFRKIFQKKMAQVVAEKLTEKTAMSAAKAFMKSYLGAIAGETGTEVMQEIVQIAGEEIAKAYSKDDFQAKMSTEEGRAEIAERLAEITWKTASGMSLIGLPGGAVSFASEYGRVRQAEGNKEVFQALGDTTATSKTFERVPDKYRALVEEMTKDGPIENVYINADRFTEYFQEQGLDPNAVAEQLGVGESYKEAAVSGGTVQIPTGVYAEKLAGSEYHQGLIEDLKFESEGFSAREAAQWQKDLKAQWESEADRIRKDQEQNIDFQESAQRVHDDIRQQIVQTQRFNDDYANIVSKAVESFAIVRGQQIGMAPYEFYQQYMLAVRDQYQAGGMELDQKLFHGGPYLFSSFDLSKIGTGEGFQGKGYGVYTGELRGVGEHYKHTVTMERSPYRVYIGDEQVDLEAIDIVTFKAVNAILAAQGDANKALKTRQSNREKYEWARKEEDFEKVDKKIEELKDKNVRQEQELQGYLYEMEVDDKVIQKMLDWDAAISDQPRAVLDALAGSYLMPGEGQLSTMTGADLYEGLVDSYRSEGGRAGNPEQLASQELAKLGIAGVKYFDAPSRQFKKGTRNYVFFDPSVLNIKTINGKPVEEYFQTGMEVKVEHRRYKSGDRKGQYVGAPELYNTPQKIPALRKLLTRLAKLGEKHKDWYRESALAVLRSVNGDMVQAEKVIQLLAIFSPSNRVGGNTTMAIKAYHQWFRGEKITAGRFGAHTKNANDLMYGGKNWEGRKTNSFYINLMTELDPSVLDRLYVREDGTQILIDKGESPKIGWIQAESPVTVDMWIARIFGYGKDSVGTAQYHFAEQEIRRTAQELGWTPHQTQAAMWVAFNGMWGQAKGGKPTTKEGYMKARSAALNTKLTKDFLEKGGLSFATYIQRATETVAWETRPTTKVPEGRAIQAMSFDLQRQFTEDSMKLVNDSGHDFVAEKLGMPLVWNAESEGAYEAQVAPNVLSGVVAEKGSDYERQHVHLYTRIMQYIFKQDAGFWFRADPTATGKDAAIGHYYEFDHDLNAKEDAKLLSLLMENVHPDIGFTRVSKRGIAVINSRTNGKPWMMSDKDFNVAMDAVMEKFADEYGIIDVGDFRAESEYLKHDWTKDPEGKEIEAEISAAGSPDLLIWVRARKKRAERIAREYAGRAQEEVTYYQSSQTETPDLFPGSIATKRTKISVPVAVDSKGSIENQKRGNVNSTGGMIAPSLVALENFWVNYEGGPVDGKGRPVVMHHATDKDFTKFQTMRTTMNTGLMGIPYEAKRAGIFVTPDAAASQGYLRREGGDNVMPLYLFAKSIINLDADWSALTGQIEDLRWGKEGGYYIPRVQYTWELFDEEYGGPEFVTALRQLGYDGAMFEEENPDTGESFTTYVAFDSNQLKSAIGNRGTFDPNSPNILQQGAQGKIQFPSDLTQAPSVITLLENANLTTFLHELGHYFYQVSSTIAAQPGAPQQIVDDIKVLHDWFRKEDPEWDGVVGVKQHEMVARGFEKYLMDGKAPSLELQPYFQRMKAWFIQVYKTLMGIDQAAGQKINLTPEVRQVFDRMLATEEQIQEAQQAAHYQNLFSDQPDGMTPTQWRNYVDMDPEATEKAKEELTARSLRDMKWLANAKSRELRRLQAEARELRKGVQAEVTEALYKEDVYAARRYLTHGIAGERTKNVLGRNHRLSLPDLKALYGEGDDALWRKLPKGKYGMVATEGLSPDVVAQQFGFGSGDALVKALIDAPKPADAIQARTDAEMMRRYGDLTDPVAMERAAESAIHNKARMKMVASELAALTKMSKGRDYRILDSAARAFAEQAMGKKKVRDIKTGQYKASEAKAAAAANRAFGKGDTEEAAKHKRAQLLQMHFFRSADNALTEVEKAVAYLKKFQREGVRKNIRQEELDQIDGLLERFELKKVSLKELQRRQDFLEWVKSQDEDSVVIDEQFLNTANRKNYRDMTLEELRGLRDSIKNVEYIGRHWDKLLKARDARKFSEHVAEMRASLEKYHNRIVKERPTATDKAGQAREGWDGYLAESRKLASILREMDGGKDGGAMWTGIGMPAIESANMETQMNMEAAEKISALFKPIKLRTAPNNIKVFRYEIPGTRLSLSDEERLVVAVYWGEEGNRQRLLDGGIVGYGKKTTREEVQKVLDTLTKEEWDFVQGVWDLAGSYRDQIAAQEKRLTGREPKWLDPAPVQTRFGVYRGGYFPAKYDAHLSTRSAMYEALADVRQMMKGAFNSSSTRHSYTKNRAEAVKGRPLKLSFNTLTSHISEVTHRLAYQDWIKDSNRIIDALDDDIRKYYGAEILHEMRRTLEDVANGDVVAKDTAERILNHIRMGSTIVGLGYRATTALIQVAGLAQSFVRVGYKWTGLGIAEFAKHPIDAMRFVNSMSPMMEERSRTFMREVNEALGTIREGGSEARIKASFFWAIGKLQKFVDIPTWIGAYRKAQYQLGYDKAVNEVEREKIEHKARLMADQAVKDAQSHGQLVDLARIQRGGAYKKIWSVFYSYFSATYNLNVENFRTKNLRNPAQMAEFISDFMVLNTLPVIFSVAMYEALRPECEDAECIARKLAAEQVRYLLGLFVYFREIGSVANLLAEDEPVWDWRGPAGTMAFGYGVQFAKQAAQGELDAAFWKSLNSFAGSVIGYPAGQINNTVEGMVAIENGDVEGIGILKALAAGPPRD